MAWTELDHDVHVVVTVLAIDESGPNPMFRTAVESTLGDKATGTLLVYAGTQLLGSDDGE